MAARGRYIRASEVGEYVFCARAWRLRRDGHAPDRGGIARAAGEEWHRRHGRSVRRARRLRRLSFVLALLALAVLAVIVVQGGR